MIVYVLSFLLLLSIIINIVCIGVLINTDDYLDIEAVSYCGDTMILRSSNKEVKISFTKICKILDDIRKRMDIANRAYSTK